MTRTSVENQERGRVVGASLLCYAIDPVWNNMYFLLGKERRNPKWPAGSEKWSDFGGRTNGKQECPEETAAREFVEETMAMVKYFEDDTIPRDKYADIVESLKRGEFTFQFTLGFGTEDRPLSYVTFVKQIPWDPRCMHRFSQCRNMLLNASNYYGGHAWRTMLGAHPAIREIITAKGDKTVQVRKDYMEKKSIGFFSVPQLQHAVENDGVLQSKNARVEQCRSMFTEVLEMFLSELCFHDPNILNDM
ncbi:MAG: hypothetical protein K0U52_06220 [Gammaproteobacteria bacterium]|nr:hypothetical protein [Gammaproteobacteria bacterium]